jgi:hypothetical protein
MNFGIYLRYTLRNPSVRIFTAAIAKQSRFPTFLFCWFEMFGFSALVAFGQQNMVTRSHVLPFASTLLHGKHGFCSQQRNARLGTTGREFVSQMHIVHSLLRTYFDYAYIQRHTPETPSGKRIQQSRLRVNDGIYMSNSGSLHIIHYSTFNFSLALTFTTYQSC